MRNSVMHKNLKYSNVDYTCTAHFPHAMWNYEFDFLQKYDLSRNI